MRILVVEDHEIVATGLRTVLSRDAHEVLSCTDIPSALSRLPSLGVDLVLLDLALPPLRDASVHIPELLAAGAPHVVCLSARNDPPTVNRALSRGASGFLSKLLDPDELLSLLGMLPHTRPILDRRTAALLVASRADPVLTEREIAVLTLASLGASNLEISHQLHISRTLVTDALSQCFDKLNVPDRASAVRVALDRGLITP